jgi:hypothetical protein
MIKKSIKKLIKRTVLYRQYLNYVYKKATIKEIKINKNTRQLFVEQYLPKNGIGAELGVLKGNFSRILIESTNAKLVHLVDPWYFLVAEWSWAGGNPSTVDAAISVLKNFKNEIEEGTVLVHIEDDCKVLKYFPDSYFDWVYIDSSHAYEHTVRELELIQKKIKNDGIIAGDDWRPDPSHRHHGVYKAVSEFIAKFDYKLLYCDEINLQWAIKKTY